MKRAYTGLRSARSVDVPEGEQGFWPSFADMMSSFALIMLFLMLISYLQNLITGNRLTVTEEKLTATEQTLTETSEEVATKSVMLSNLQLALEDAQAAMRKQQEEMAIYAATITEQTARIDAQSEEINAQSVKLDERTAELARQAALLAAQDEQLSQKESELIELDSTIAEQKKYIQMTTEELTQLRAQMSTVAYLRLNIVKQIQKSIADTLEGTSTVSVGDNGNLVLGAGLFFDHGRHNIKPESHELLNNLEEAFYKFLSDDENIKYVDSIVIAGHTDSTGPADENRVLSTQRAYEVLNYLMKANGGELERFEQYFCAAGYGESRLKVANEVTAEDKAQNRRIEISITLKDESVLQIMDDYLKTTIPQ